MLNSPYDIFLLKIGNKLMYLQVEYIDMIRRSEGDEPNY